MKQFVLTNRKAFGIGLAIYQLLGGVAGLLFVYSLVNEQTSAGAYFIIVPIVALYIISMLSGLFYFWKGNKWRFYFLTKLSLCLQVIQLIVHGFAFIFYYGPYLGVGFDGEYNFVIRFEPLKLNFLVHFGETENQSVMINIVPIILLIILRWLERNTTEKNEEAEHFLEEPPAGSNG